MSSVSQVVFMNQRSFSLPEPAIGDAYQGGFYAGLFSVNANGVATHRLVVASKSVGEFYGAWSPGLATSNGTSEFNGASNTAAMVAISSPLGTSSSNLVAGGYDDWYMPAKKEMEQLYFYFKPDTNQNSDKGSNSYAVPQRSSYTTSPSVPARTSLSAWQAAGDGSGGAQFFNRGTDGSSAPFYWDSTEASSSKAFRREMRTGYYADSYGNRGAYKNQQGNARAIRKVAI
jgi:hypothetical protein